MGSAARVFPTAYPTFWFWFCSLLVHACDVVSQSTNRQPSPPRLFTLNFFIVAVTFFRIYVAQLFLFDFYGSKPPFGSDLCCTEFLLLIVADQALFLDEAVFLTMDGYFLMLVHFSGWCRISSCLFFFKSIIFLHISGILLDEGALLSLWGFLFFPAGIWGASIQPPSLGLGHC